MAMMKCKECGGDVSTKAAACPKCGAKTPRKTSLGTKLVAGLLGIGVLGAVIGNSSKTPPAPRPPEDPKAVAARQAEDARMSLAIEVGKAVKAQLRDPDSLKFRALGVNEDATVACGQYQAKNGFGGMNQQAVIVVNGKAVAFSESEWKKRCTGLRDYLAAAP